MGGSIKYRQAGSFDIGGDSGEETGAENSQPRSDLEGIQIHAGG